MGSNLTLGTGTGTGAGMGMGTGTGLFHVPSTEYGLNLDSERTDRVLTEKSQKSWYGYGNGYGLFLKHKVRERIRTRVRTSEYVPNPYLIV